MNKTSNISDLYKSQQIDPKGNKGKTIEGNKLEFTTTIGKLGKTNKLIRLNQKNESLHNFVSDTIERGQNKKAIENKKTLSRKKRNLKKMQKTCITKKS